MIRALSQISQCQRDPPVGLVECWEDELLHKGESRLFLEIHTSVPGGLVEPASASSSQWSEQKEGWGLPCPMVLKSLKF